MIFSAFYQDICNFAKFFLFFHKCFRKRMSCTLYVGMWGVVRMGVLPRSYCPPCSCFLPRSYSLRGGTLCHDRNPPVRATACRRHPCHAPDVPSERMGEGTAAAPKERRWWKDSLRGTNPPPAHTDRKHYPRLRRDLVRRREVSRTHKGAFFFTKKAPCVNQTLCVAERGKSLQT